MKMMSACKGVAAFLALFLCDETKKQFLPFHLFLFLSLRAFFVEGFFFFVFFDSSKKKVLLFAVVVVVVVVCFYCVVLV